jgi:hypothetical protein
MRRSVWESGESVDGRRDVNTGSTSDQRSAISDRQYPRTCLAPASATGVSCRSRFQEPVVPEKPSRSFRLVLVQVLIVQLLSLAALWWLQARYGR